MALIDDRTTHLNLPIPNKQNLLEDDVERLRQAFTTLDTHAQSVDGINDALGTAANRDVGAGAADIPDTTQLDTRLGTAGNLGTAAQQNVGSGVDEIPDTEILDNRLGTTGNLGSAALLDAGLPDGVATLSSNGKIPQEQIPDSVLGQLEYQGVWDPLTNTPTLPSVPDKKGDYYICTASGTQFGIDFTLGDWIVSNGTSWDKVDNTDAVSSVQGRTGNVTITKEDFASTDAASRTVGTDVDNVPDNAQLNERLGTNGNLGTAATRNVGTAAGYVPLYEDVVDVVSAQTVTGQKTFKNSGETVKFADTATGSTANPFAGFYDGANVRLGYIGVGSSANNRMIIRSEDSSSLGGIQFTAAYNGANAILFSNKTTFEDTITAQGSSYLSTTYTKDLLRVSANTSPEVSISGDAYGTNNSQGDIYGQLNFETTSNLYGTGAHAYIRAIHTRAGSAHNNQDAGLVFGTSSATNDALAVPRMHLSAVTGFLAIDGSEPDPDAPLWVARNGGSPLVARFIQKANGGDCVTRWSGYRGSDGAARYADLLLDADTYTFSIMSPAASGPTIRGVELASDGSVAFGGGGVGVNYRFQFNQALLDDYSAICVGQQSTPSYDTGIYLRTTSEGRISVGSGAKLTFYRNGPTSDLMATMDANGVTSNKFRRSSDVTLKENLKPLRITRKQRDSLRAYIFTWVANENVPKHLRGTVDEGVIAQHIEKVFPSCVDTDEKTGLKTVDYGKAALLLCTCEVISDHWLARAWRWARGDG